MGFPVIPSRLTVVPLAFCLVAFVVTGTVVAQDDDLAAMTTNALIQVASEYRISLTDQKQPLSFREDPLLVWVNPVRQSQQGVVHVWTHEGRARVIGCVFVNTTDTGTKQIIHELHSLAPTGLTATIERSGDVWHPKAAGADFRLLEDAAPPSESRSRRLLEMRRLGREFAAHSIDFEGGRWQLRLLPQPLYRYETGDDIHDGAVFSMVSNAGTDPEILLTFEVRDTQNGPRWHYAPARFSDLRLFLDHKDKPIWKFEAPPGVVSYSYQASAEDTYRLFIDRGMTAAEFETFLEQQE